MSRILIIDEIDSQRDNLFSFFGQEGFTVAGYDSVAGGLGGICNENVDIIIADLRNGDLSGLDTVREIKSNAPSASIILLTAYGSEDLAFNAVRAGFVYDFVIKPFELEELMMVVERALEKKLLSDRIDSLEKELQDKYRFDGTIGNSREILNVLKTVVKVSSTDSTVLITGESGTGKEIIGRSIHFNSQRRNKPLISFDCSTTPEKLHVRELFGGTLTDSNGKESHKPGLIGRAQNGTVIIDEIAGLSGEAQNLLLDFLHSREVKTNGHCVSVDARIIAMTNRDIDTDVQDERFNENLYSLLNVIPIFIPPLRERRGDIEQLIDYFLKEIGKKMKKPNMKVSRRAISLLTNYNWPGNVRELERTIERCMIICESDTISPADLPLEINRQTDAHIHNALDKDMTIAELEREYILEVLDHTSWNKTKASERLGITRATLLNKLKLYKNGKKVP